ncbi:MAG TPA: PBP1A family penicillin-binding protein [Vicinamibacterales bacterium]|jgi:penicillin-binding protein 1A|nr:PBP1A family penicillin-binding protein [Vicinamibacterales bacterium]
MTVVVRFARQAGIVALFVAAALGGTLSGVLFAYSDDLPEVSALDNYTPNTITRVLGRDGALVGEFAVERRVVVRYDDIPLVLRQAILAAEDSGFFDHAGLSISRMMLALLRDIVSSGNVPGGSTLTQQLARNLFPKTIGFDRTWERKIKEALVSIQIEKRYSKPEIFSMYCNQIYFGHGAYGVEAASQLYFRKHLKDLQLEEAALIAGIIQANVRQSPYVNPEAAKRRRNYALDRMASEGFITAEQANEAKAKPIVVTGEPGGDGSPAPYFLEEVRKYLEAKYGAKALYESGLTVSTPLDLELQLAANRAIDRGTRRADKRRGVFRKPQRNVLAEKHTLEGFRHDRWARPMAEGDIVPAVVTSVSDGTAKVRMGSLTAELNKAAIQWTRKTSAADLVKVGDLVDVDLLKINAEAGTATVTIEQPPAIEGALVAIDNKTGEVISMVGGFSFSRSKFNRATQAFRQMGSTVKPFLYTAAIDRGLTPTTLIDDVPTTFDAGAGQPPYTPGNYDRKFMGTMTLRRALEQSRNIPAVKVIDMLGPPQVAAYAARFGFKEPFRPFLSMALGAQEATLIDMTSAYSVFPNHGIRMVPYSVISITDREGTLLEENRSTPRDAIRADTAYVMTNLLRGVVLRGTGAAANALDWPLAGKTGTVDDYTDAWFIGFDPNVTVGVWLGRDEKKPIGPNETGTLAALPMWIEFMKSYIELRGNREQPPTFDPPGNIVFMAVDRNSGEPVADGQDGAITEAFLSGTQPQREMR